MRVETSDGITIDCLPDTAVCNADEEKRSPLELNDCPSGCAECKPDICCYYGE